MMQNEPGNPRERIAFISDADEFAGAEVSMVLLTARLRERYEFTAILSGEAAEETKRKLRESGASLASVRHLSRRPRPLAVRRLVSTLRRLRPAALNVNMSDQGDGLGSLIAGRLTRTPTIATVRNVIPDRTPLKERVSRFGLSLADVVIAPSDFVADYVRKLGVEAVRVVKNGSEAPVPHADARTELGIREGSFVVGGVGRLHDQKGWDVLCRAAALVHQERPEVEFVVVGEGRQRAELESMPECRHVRFVGYRESASSLIAGFDLLAVPSRYEAFGRVAAEAMLSGVPVVASEVGGLPEVLGDAGVLVPPERADLLAAAIVELSRDARLRERLAEGGRERAGALFTVSRMASETAAVVDELLHRRPTIALISGATEFAGAEVSLVLIAESLRGAYDFVALVTDAAPPELVRRLRAAGAQVRVVRGLQRRPTLTSLVGLLVALLRLRPAVVHLNMTDQGDALASALAARIAGRRVVATVHNVIPGRSPLRERAAAAVVRSTDVAIGVSDFVKGYLDGIGAHAVSVKNGIPAPQPVSDARARLGLPPGAFVVGGVGRLHDQKGWDVLCRAAALVHQEAPEVEFVVVGEGRLRAYLESMPECGHVRFVGYRESASSLIAAFDLLAVPSRYEGFGLVAIEAMLSRVPVVASEVGGLPEVLDETGVLVPPERPDLLAEAILALSRDPGRRAELASAAVERARVYFSAERAVAEVDAVYRSVVG